MNVRMGHWWMTLTGKCQGTRSKKHVCHYHFVHLKYHVIQCLPHILLIPDVPGLSRTTAVTQRIIIFVLNNVKILTFVTEVCCYKSVLKYTLQDFLIVFGLLPVVSHGVEHSSVLF